MWQNKIVRTVTIIVGALIALALVPRVWLKLYSTVKCSKGATYQVVYEADLVTLLRDLAKNKDARFDEIMTELSKTAATPNADYFAALQQKFSAAGIRFNSYFGSRAQTDAQIIDELRKNVAAAIDGNIKILNNRLEQFGICKHLINKQGNHRIVIKLKLPAAIDVERVKQVFGKTARLEFNLVENSQIFQDFITRIDNLLKRDLKAKPGWMADSTGAGGKISKDKAVNVSELFAGSSIVPDDSSSSSQDSVQVDKDIFSGNPFISLLRDVGRGEVAAPVKNVRAVERILNNPEVQKLIPPDAKFAWSNKPEQIADEKYYYLYLLKKEPELTGAYLTEARAQIVSGSGLTRQGEWAVSIQLNEEGTKIFSRLTGANVNKRLAIVIDDKVVMAPNIKEKIPNGSASLEGNMSAIEAKDLAILLRAGSLQVPMKTVEVRIVESPSTQQ